METEIKLKDIAAKWYTTKVLVISDDYDDEIIFSKEEAIQLRDFLNQLNLGDEK